MNESHNAPHESEDGEGEEDEDTQHEVRAKAWRKNGAAWKDAHLPHADDEPSSLLDDRAVTACLAAAEGAETFRAVKIQAPADASVEERLALIGRLARLLR